MRRSWIYEGFRFPTIFFDLAGPASQIRSFRWHPGWEREGIRSSLKVAIGDIIWYGSGTAQHLGGLITNHFDLLAQPYV